MDEETKSKYVEQLRRYEQTGESVRVNVRLERPGPAVAGGDVQFPGCSNVTGVIELNLDSDCFTVRTRDGWNRWPIRAIWEIQPASIFDVPVIFCVLMLAGVNNGQG